MSFFFLFSPCPHHPFNPFTWTIPSNFLEETFVSHRRNIVRFCFTRCKKNCFDFSPVNFWSSLFFFGNFSWFFNSDQNWSVPNYWYLNRDNFHERRSNLLQIIGMDPLYEIFKAFWPFFIINMKEKLPFIIRCWFWWGKCFYKRWYQIVCKSSKHVFIYRHLWMKLETLTWK